MGPLFTAEYCEAQAEANLAQAQEVGNLTLRMELLAEATAWATLAVAKRSGFVAKDSSQHVDRRG